MNLEGSPVVDQFESRINYSWSSGTGYKGMPADHFSVRWTGTICSDKNADV